MGQLIQSALYSCALLGIETVQARSEFTSVDL